MQGPSAASGGRVAATRRGPRAVVPALLMAASPLLGEDVGVGGGGAPAVVQSVPGGQQGKDAVGSRGWAEPAAALTGEAPGMRSLQVVSLLFQEGCGLRMPARVSIPCGPLASPPAFPRRPACAPTYTLVALSYTALSTSPAAYLGALSGAAGCLSSSPFLRRKRNVPHVTLNLSALLTISPSPAASSGEV